MRTPAVSVLVICYNQASLIRETVESAVAQDLDSLEVVVADDGSTDGTAEEVLKLAAEYPGVVVPVVGEHVGIPQNANRGLERCRGEFMALLGGDDLFLPGKLTAQLAWMREDPRRVLCGHDAYIFDHETGLNRRLYTDLSGWKEGAGPKTFLSQGFPYLPTSVMLRRSAIPAYGFDVRVPLVCDGKIFIDSLIGGGRHGHLPGIYARYRRHANNLTSHASDRVIADAFSMLSIVEKDHPELAAACRHGRARLHMRSGVVELGAGNGKVARAHLRTALTNAPTLSWKLPAWYALSWLPARLNSQLLEWAKRRRVGLT